MTDNDPRVEAAAAALFRYDTEPRPLNLDQDPQPSEWEDMARRALAAADAVDPLRDDDKLTALARIFRRPSSCSPPSGKAAPDD